MNLTKTVDEIVAEHQEKYPAEFEAAVIEWIERVREDVWKWPDKGLQRAFFETAQSAIWPLRDAGVSADDALVILKKVFVPSEFYAAYERGLE